jgi:ParB/RepB/Spo0J family partition protein
MADTISSPRQVDLEADMSAPRGLVALLSQVHPSPDNVRRTPPSDDDNRKMRESVASAGIIEPILVREMPTGCGWEIINGHRRRAAALELGLMHVPIIVRAGGEAEHLAAQAVTNMMHAPLAPVDQWEAIKALQDRGYSLSDAAHMLGLEERKARRLSLLGQLHPDILEQIRLHGRPSDYQLAAVARAPAKTPAAALKAKSCWKGKGKAAELSWHDLVMACERQRIPLSRAVFKPAEHGVAFEEDLFAEPGSNDQFTTSDVIGFMKAQEAALYDEAEASKGKVKVADWSASQYQPAIPKGWEACPYGTKPKGSVVFKAIVPSGHDIGRVTERRAMPKPKPSPKNPPADLARSPATVEEDQAAQPTTARGPITQKGLEMLAEARTQAIRTALRNRAEEMKESELLELLLLALCGSNVQVSGESRAWNGHRMSCDFEDLAAALLDGKGEQRELEHGAVRRLAAEAIARMVVVGPVKSGTSSGLPAQWIGRRLDPQDEMPRLDTAEFLATLSHDALRQVAVRRGVPGTGSAKALRERLIGSAPFMTLPEAAWAQDGPQALPFPQGEED